LYLEVQNKDLLWPEIRIRILQMRLRENKEMLGYCSKCCTDYTIRQMANQIHGRNDRNFWSMKNVDLGMKKQSE